MKIVDKLKYLKPLETYSFYKWIDEYWWSIIISVDPIVVLSFETYDNDINYEIKRLDKILGLRAELSSRQNMKKATDEQCGMLIKKLFDPKSKLIYGLD
jgi:hypothetical protein